MKEYGPLTLVRAVGGWIPDRTETTARTYIAQVRTCALR